jgi:hypothetical protein
MLKKVSVLSGPQVVIIYTLLQSTYCLHLKGLHYRLSLSGAQPPDCFRYASRYVRGLRRLRHRSKGDDYSIPGTYSIELYSFATRQSTTPSIQRIKHLLNYLSRAEITQHNRKFSALLLPSQRPSILTKEIMNATNDDMHPQLDASKSEKKPPAKANRVKKVKREGLPKRPMSAYNVFFKEERLRWLNEEEKGQGNNQANAR